MNLKELRRKIVDRMKAFFGAFPEPLPVPPDYNKDEPIPNAFTAKQHYLMWLRKKYGVNANTSVLTDAEAYWLFRYWGPYVELEKLPIKFYNSQGRADYLPGAN